MKPFLSVDGQLQQLRDRGLMIADAEHTAAQQFLQDHNYYRVSGYFRYFQVDPPSGKNRFRSDTTWEMIQQPYTFDQQLRELLQSGLAEFEIVFRSQLAYLMAKSGGPVSYLEERTYDNRSGGKPREKLLIDIRQDVDRSDERFVKHHSKRGESMPIWAAVEVLSLGTTSKMYGLVTDVEGVYRPLATRFGLSVRASRQVFRSMTVLRNVCAHHGRIWNRCDGIEVETPPPARGKGNPGVHKNTPWAWAMTLGYLVDKTRGDDTYSNSLWDFFDTHPDALVDGMTYPSDM